MNLLKLSWERPEAGHRLVEVHGEPWVVEVEADAEAGRVASEPDPAAFRRAAALDLEDPDAILDFANRHGLLGAWVFGKNGPLRLVKVEGVPHQGERLATWTAELPFLAHAVGMVEALREGDVRAIKRLASEVDVSPSTKVALKDDVHAAGWSVVDRLVERQLPRFFRVGVEPAGEGRRLGIFVDNLLGMLWAQLGLWLTEDRVELRECDRCGKWFSIARRGSGRRDHKRFCSAACKKGDYRARQDKARQLLRRRKTPGAIAKEVGSTPDVVGRWLYGPGNEGQTSKRGTRRRTRRRTR